MATGKIDREQWERQAQPGELGFHLQQAHIIDLETDAGREWTHWGFARDDFAGRVVMDAGCGPGLMAAWFTGVSKLIALDPLLSEYRQVAGHNLDLADIALSRPMESLDCELAKSVDVVFSRNALDHVYDFMLAICNIATYLRDGGFAWLSFDLADEPRDDLHSLVMDRAYCEAAFAECDLAITQHHVGGLPSGRRSYHPVGEAHSWWLRKELE